MEETHLGCGGLARLWYRSPVVMFKSAARSAHSKSFPQAHHCALHRGYERFFLVGNCKHIGANGCYCFARPQNLSSRDKRFAFTWSEQVDLEFDAQDIRARWH